MDYWRWNLIKDNGSRYEIYEEKFKLYSDRSQNKQRNNIWIKVTSAIKKINVYKSNWTNHMNRIPRNTLQRILKQISTKGRRNPEIPMKGMTDS